MYDLVQRLAGRWYSLRRLGAVIAPLRSVSRVLDLGGGTGTYRELWSPICTYLCLDVDPVKLAGFRSKFNGDFSILGDATRIPLKAYSVDVVLCSAVSHHLTDDALESLVLETVRVLNTGGRFIFLDAVMEPRWWPGRLLWKYDRGSYPRSKEALQSTIARHTDIILMQEFRYIHKYILCVGAKAAHPRKCEKSMSNGCVTC